MGLAIATLVGVLGIAPPTPSTATIRVTWHAPKTCPERERVEELVAEHLGRPLERGEGSDLVEIAGVVGAPASEGAPWTLELYISHAEATGTRGLEADTCGELVDAAALIIAMAIDPGLLTGDEGPAVPVPEPIELEAPAEPEHEPAPARETEPEPRPRHRAPAAGTLRLAGGVGFGPQPGPFGTIDLRGTAKFGRARLEIGIEHGIASTTERGDGVGGRFWSVGADAAGCFVPDVATVEFPLCAGARIAAIHGVASGPGVEPRPQTRPWGGFELGAGVDWTPKSRTGPKNPWVVVFLRGTVGLSPADFGFVVGGVGEVFRPGLLYGGVIAGVGLRLAKKPRSGTDRATSGN